MNGLRLVDRSLAPVMLRTMTRRYVVGMVLYVVAYALLFVDVSLSLALVVALALIFILPELESGTEKPEESAEKLD